ncbi:MAG TPA: universal stress protein [Chthoniobacterales bacterium]|jgi:amino acid transporter/nucleotide-binding universal stress UspA family protein|nr:universal stress protein [Chthoniobacterales bacterium]
MIPTNIKRPRNVDAPRAAAILYGDWGTSKAYVIGLAFAVAGYASFWLIAAMCVLTALVGLNYMVICRLYPDGGGVYASVRHRSQVISIVGAFLLIADYLVTAAISALSAFAYLGVPNPEKFAAAAILIIGLLNLLGPKHTGGLAFLISVPTALVVITLGLFSLPHMGEAIGHLQPLHGTFWQNWAGFVGIVLALSGVEAIANATGVMRLDPGSTDEHPSVVKTSTPAILWVMIEVCVFTALLGLAMHALGGLQIVNGDVNAPGAPGVRDYMLRYMGEIFVGGALGPALGHAFGFIVSIVFALLLLSAVNTAIVDLIMIQFLMSRDRELPALFQRLNQWGVPSFGMLLATIVPMSLVILVKDMAGLADLYAVGVVGAIATNLGATATDRKLLIKTWERTLMFGTFIVMFAIEMSLLIDKPNARYFAVTILAVGLILRGLVQERRAKKEAKPLLGPETVSVDTQSSVAIARSGSNSPLSASRTHSSIGELEGTESILCAIRGTGRTLDFALREARDTRNRLYLLFVREQPFMTEQDVKRKWQEDPEASSIFAEAKSKTDADHPPLFCYAVSPSAAETIVDVAATLGASRLILGAPKRNALLNLLRGNVIREVSNLLPEEIDLLVYA